MKYIVNGKTVVAIMENTELDAYRFMMANMPIVLDMFPGKYGEISNKLLMAKSYVGVAKCSPNDEFNLEYGKKLAAARAKLKHDRRMWSIVQECFKAGISQITKGMAKMEMKYSKSCRDIGAFGTEFRGKGQ